MLQNIFCYNKFECRKLISVIVEQLLTSADIDIKKFKKQTLPFLSNYINNEYPEFFLLSLVKESC